MSSYYMYQDFQQSEILRFVHKMYLCVYVYLRMNSYYLPIQYHFSCLYNRECCIQVQVKLSFQGIKLHTVRLREIYNTINNLKFQINISLNLFQFCFCA